MRSAKTNPSRSTISPGDTSIGAEVGSIPNERVKLAALAAWVRGRRQISEQRLIIGATGQPSRHLARINADERGAKATIDHPLRKADCVLAPNWEDAGQSGASHLLFAVIANVLKEQIAERDSRYTALFELLDRFAHASLVDRIDALGRYPNLVHRQSKCRCLPLQ